MSASTLCAICLLCGTLFGCAREKEGYEAPPKVDGLIAGAALPTLRVSCANGGQRLLSPADRAQLVTFATATDCYTCKEHLDGFAAPLGPGRDLEYFILVLAPAGAWVEAASSFRPLTTRDICVDTASAGIWKRLPIVHTPTTVVLRGGSVRELMRGPYTTPYVKELLWKRINAASGLASPRQH